MILLSNRLRFVFCAMALLLSLVPVSCNKARPDAKAELLGSLQGANLGGFFFETRDDGAQEIVSMTNSIVAGAIRTDSDTTLVLRYTRVKDLKTNTSTTYKMEAIKAGDQLTLQVTDIASGASLMRETGEFPAAPPAAPGDAPCSPAFNSLGDCICSLRASLLFEANRTCEPQPGQAVCCINGDHLISVHLLVMPTNLRCLTVFTGFDDLVFFRG